jgi:hypothetical protein
VVTDDVDKYPLRAGFAPGVTVRPRAELGRRIWMGDARKRAPM